MHPHPAWGSPLHRLGVAILAAALGLTLGARPGAVQPAIAAGPLRVEADATYQLDPGDGRVHVAIDFELTNLKPNTATTIFYYASAAFVVQPEAVDIEASDAAGPLPISTRDRQDFTRVDIELRSLLYYNQTARFTLSYDMPGGAPRSSSWVRVGPAFATFGVWAWGDAGRSTVEVRIPNGYETQVDGDSLMREPAGGGERLRASPTRPRSFYSIVTAENPDAYESQRISLEGDIELVIRAWPDDDRWARTVGTTLSTGLPDLVELIGLPWPVNHDLEVRERFTPALEGYAGIFLTLEEAIELSEDLDPLTIMHEASHAWFNDDLFEERWIYEGLAEEYSWRVQAAAGGPSGFGPVEPDVGDRGHVPLDGWTFPSGIYNEITEQRELYGYQASFWAVHTIVEVAGIETMQAAFEAADENWTAYPGAGGPEMVGVVDGWQRFLDLAQPVSQPDSAAVEALFKELVLDTRGDIALLDQRHDARAAYRELVAEGEGWLPGWYVRRPMSEWTFAVAQRAIDEATAVLAQRDQVEALAAGLGLAPDDAARSAYETATADFGRANAIVQDQLEALAAIEGARSASAGSLDPVAQLGLLGGATPAGAYDAARAAFERGELDAAIASAAAAASLLAGATALGQQRFVMIGAAAAVLLLAAVLLVWRRRRRGRALASVGSSAGAAAPRDMLRDPPGASIAPPAAPGVPPASDWPPRDLAPRQVLDQPEPAWWLPTRSSPDPATLAADPAAPSPPSAANESEMEGGAPPRDPPDDASG